MSNRVRVGITKLTKSDSGRYICGLDRDWFPNSHDLIEIIVEDAPTTSKPKWTLRPFSTEVQSASTPPTPQRQSSSSRRFTSSSSSPETPTHQQQTEGTAAPASELPVEAEYASVSKAADDSSELAYSELRFPVVTASSLNASSRANDVIYSMIQVEASSEAKLKEDASPPPSYQPAPSKRTRTEESQRGWRWREVQIEDEGGSTEVKKKGGAPGPRGENKEEEEEESVTRRKQRIQDKRRQKETPHLQRPSHLHRSRSPPPPSPGLPVDWLVHLPPSKAPQSVGRDNGS
ncbi:hypothetical protein F7725_001188 [Dissostichus mawsoni]|uniref:Uncharacterized protein n=1 Tax=Dissostichus mawsoni TaxID=36200 RepID=A0A7J5ZH34_DISMA|nr:hypothetical protein F7725_001188 [Dissostichus mawsoni]